MTSYTVSIDSDLPRDRVIESFDAPDNLVKRQNGLQHFERISGEPGVPGAKSRLIGLCGKRPMELIETVLGRRRPSREHEHRTSSPQCE